MTNDDNFFPKSFLNYSCETCAFNTSRLSQYNIHLMTAKHKKMTNDDTILSAGVLELKFNCECGKTYKHRQGLHIHKKRCNLETQQVVVLENQVVLPTLDNTMVFELIKQNQEFKELLIEQNKKIMELSREPRVINNTNCTQNTNFNLQLFLNETCKDAISADQFIKDIQISFTDLENIGSQGYIQGFTDLIMKQLRIMDVTKRPLHCTDIKRETIYIKEADTWNKDNEDKTKLKNVIEKVANKSRKNVAGWQRSHPEVSVLDSNDYTMNHNILRHTWGDGDTEKLKEKVIRNIAKEVHIDRLGK